MEDQGELSKGHFPDWVPAPSENPLSSLYTMDTLFSVSHQPKALDTSVLR